MEIKKDIFFLVFGVFITILISYFIIRSFIIPLLFTFLLVYILYPLYSRLKKYTKTHTLTSLIIIFSFLILFLIPFFMLFVQISTEVLSIDSQKVESSLLHANNYFKENFNLNVNFLDEYNLFLSKSQEFVTDLVLQVPEFLFQIFLIVFFYYYFSREYNLEILLFKRMFGELRFENLKCRFKNLVDAIIYGQILVRVIQSFIGLIGFLILGIDNAFLWSFIMFFVSFLPLIGTGLVWLPLGVLNFLNGNYFTAILIILLGIFISFIDNLLLPYLISDKAKVGPVLILISILGGIEVFGIYGILLGPFILGTLFVLFEEVFSEFANKNPRIRKFIWSELEREKYRSLKTDAARAQYVKILTKKYEIEEKQDNLRGIKSEV